ncbi:MAG: substrate-binding domain-containing protein [Comamonas sp.]
MNRFFLKTTRRVALLTTALVLAGCSSVGSQPAKTQLHVMTSGGFTAAYDELRPQFEKQSGYVVKTAYGASTGGASDSIPSRLGRGEPADIVILARSALDALVKDGKVIPGSEVDLVKSSMGLVVKQGAPRPDISTVDAFKRALLNAPSIAYSASASGIYYETELMKKLGIENELKPKSKRIVSERVGTVVARGDAAIGMQQVSELLPIPGVDFVGKIPEELQRVTVFSAGIAASSKHPDSARELIKFLHSDAASPAIVKSGLEPYRAK